jgi:Xaa-Pro dipeptidase
MPGPNMLHASVMGFHVSERPVVAIFTTDGKGGLVVPVLEASTADTAYNPVTPFTYSDEEGYEPAFSKACAAMGLAGSTIGVEALQLRLLEIRALEHHAPGCRLVTAEDILAGPRMRKDESEVALMRKAITFTQIGLEATAWQIKAGMSEREVVSLLTIEMLRAGAERMAFGPLVVAGPNAASPHTSAGDRPIEPGDTIVIDCGAAYKAYNGDITRTFSVGPLNAEMARVYDIVRAANHAGKEAVRPGVTAESVDRAARNVIEQAGYGEYFFHRTGHGLGLEVHEPPYIVAGNRLVLEPGMVFTVEPGIYLPGRGGVRIEDDVFVTESGCESLTTFPREFRAL